MLRIEENRSGLRSGSLSDSLSGFLSGLRPDHSGLRPECLRSETGVIPIGESYSGLAPVWTVSIPVWTGIDYRLRILFRSGSGLGRFYSGLRPFLFRSGPE